MYATFWLFLSTLVAIGCNGDKPIQGDTGTVTTGTNDTETNDDTSPLTACEKFADPKYILDEVPGELVGSLDNSNAIISLTEGECALEHAPYGVQGEGPEAVLRIQNLTPGEAYLAKLQSDADLLFYIATGCTGDGHFSENDCLTFVDASTGSLEHDVFTAPDSGVVYAVVDFWKDDVPQSSEFLFSIGPADCETIESCTEDDAPICLRGVCVECLENSDCSFDFPMCTDSNECATGYDECESDDEREHGDDTVTWATEIQLDAAWTENEDGSSQALFNSQICAAPYSSSNGSLERDYYRFTVDTPGEFWSFNLSWPDETADLDLYVMDDNGVYFGMTYWKNPEIIDLSFLPAGSYTVMVKQYTDGSSTVAIDYTLLAVQYPGASCTSSTDCASEYMTQYYRGSCETDGACHFISGDGMVPLWGACDSDDDCDDNSLMCTSFSFASNLDQRAFCTPSCTNDADCENSICMSDSDGVYFCAMPCESNEQCGAVVGQEALDASPWIYPECDTVSGQCSY